jgi:hypothetical protein
MMQSAYLSKRIDIDPRDLEEVAGGWHSRLSGKPRAFGMVRACKGFWLGEQTPDLAAAYAARGLVWTDGRPVPVILECTQWSESESELGVYPRTLGWPVGTARYARRVLAALDDISEALYSSRRKAMIPVRSCQGMNRALAESPAPPASLGRYVTRTSGTYRREAPPRVLTRQT